MTPIPEFTVVHTQTARPSEITVDHDIPLDTNATFLSALMDLKGKGQADSLLIDNSPSQDLASKEGSGTEQEDDPRALGTDRRKGETEIQDLGPDATEQLIDAEPVGFEHAKDTKDGASSALDFGAATLQPEQVRPESLKISHHDVPQITPIGTREGSPMASTIPENQRIDPNGGSILGSESAPLQQALLFPSTWPRAQPLESQSTFAEQKAGKQDLANAFTAQKDERDISSDKAPIAELKTLGPDRLETAESLESSQELPILENSDPGRGSPRLFASEQNTKGWPTTLVGTAKPADVIEKEERSSPDRKAQKIDNSKLVNSASPDPFKANFEIEPYYSVPPARSTVAASEPNGVAALASQAKAPMSGIKLDPSLEKESKLRKFEPIGTPLVPQTHIPSTPHPVHLTVAVPQVPTHPAGKLEAVSIGVVQSDGSVEVTLKPEELGRITLKLESHGNTTHVVMTAERPDTQELMKRHLDLLQTQLRDMGYENPKFDFGHPQTAPGGSARSDQEDEATVGTAPLTKTIVVNAPQSGLDIKV